MTNSLKEILALKIYKKKKLKLDQINFLNENGYLLLEPKLDFWKWIGATPNELIDITNKIILEEGLKAGSEGKEEFTIKKKKTIEPGANRIGNLLNKNRFFINLATLPEIVWGSYLVIQDEIKLSSVLFREPKKNSGDQNIHVDWIPRESLSEGFSSFVAFLYLNDTNKLNGATKIVPKSHQKLSYPDKYIDPKLPYDKEITIDAKAGSILLLNSLVWHRGGNNLTGEKRGIIVVEYRKRNLKQLLNLNTYLSKEVKSKLNTNEKYLFGLRDQDIKQNEKSFGPGDHYRNWLKNNNHF